MRKIGILGGMGPEATIALMARIVALVLAEDDGDHIPLIVDQNPQVPSRIAHLIHGTGPDPTPVLVEMARGLERAGAQALALPCNTAYAYKQAIQDAVSIPFLDMIEASSRALPDGPVALMASPAVRKVGVFDAVLKGREVQHLDPELALALIRKLKTEGINKDTIAGYSALCDSVGDAFPLVACTEFSLVAKGRGIDTLDVLSRLCVDFSQR